MDVDKIEGSAGARDDAQSVRQCLLGERRAVQRNQDGAEDGVAYFLESLTQRRFVEKPWLLPVIASPRRK